MAVLIFSNSYIENDRHYTRFHVLLIVFVHAIYLLILSPNIIRVLVGWDGLGVRSFVLVVYYQREKALNAGILTILRNRVGDIIILRRLGLSFNLGNWNTTLLLIRETPIWETPEIIKYFLVLAAITKRAQIPFSAWLPAAISAPTPVSALVHSSTLVTAGIFILIRFHSLIVLDQGSVYLLLLIGTLTRFIGGIRALLEKDIKKIVALSTLSQLGIIIRILGIGIKDICFFHLVIHAFFKALLFITVGNLIHLSDNYQDLRKIKFSTTNICVSFRFMNIANFSLCGMPFIAGFYSKDLFLEICAIRNINIYILLIYFLSVGLTTLYTFRFFILTFWAFPRNLTPAFVVDKNKNVITARFILWSLAIFRGTYLNWLIFPNFWVIFIPWEIKNITLRLIIIRIFLSFINFSVKYFTSSPLNTFILNIWNLPLISTKPLVTPTLQLRKYALFWGDQFWVNYWTYINIKNSISDLGVTQRSLLYKNFFKHLSLSIILLLLILML